MSRHPQGFRRAVAGEATTGSHRLRPVEVRIAAGFLGRARGLIGRPPLPPGVGLLLERTRCVHGLGMRRTLDLVFVDADSIVRRVCALPPMRWRGCIGAASVLEFEAGQADALDLRVGDRLDWSSVPARNGGTAARAGGFAAAIVLLAQPSQGDAQMAGAFPPGWVARFEARAESLYRAGEDAAAIQAWETLVRMDPSRRALGALRVGNVHQRHDRPWRAMRSYQQALEAAPDPDERMLDARRKALSNLLGLLDAVAERAADALDRHVDPATPRLAPSAAIADDPSPSASASASASALASTSASASASAMPAMSAVPSATPGGMPRIEYLRSSPPLAEPVRTRARRTR
ncbi:MAG: DUF192 domain-containing protein [Lautropia sp.]